MKNQSVPSSKPLVKSEIPSITNMQQRSVILFHSAIKSKSTQETYDTNLRKFLDYFIIKSYDSLLKIKPKKTQEMIEDYVLHLRGRELSKSSIKSTVCALELFYSMNDVMLNFKKIKKMYPQAKKPRNSNPYTTEQVKQMIHAFARDPKYIALVHFLSASGVRAGFAEYLKIKHLQDMPNGCKSVKVYADEKEEYFTFIHKEAVTALEYYFEMRKKQGEILDEESYVFVKRGNKKKPLSQIDITGRFAHTIRTYLPQGEMKDGRYDTALVHGLRKRWNTIMKNNQEINPLMIEKMFGHSSRLIPLDSVYHKPSLDILFEEYQKGISDLMLDDNERLKIKIQNQQSELERIREKDEQITTLQEQLHEVQKHLKELASRG